MAKRRRTIQHNPLDDPTPATPAATADDSPSRPRNRARRARSAAEQPEEAPIETRMASLERENQWMWWVAAGLVVVVLLG